MAILYAPSLSKRIRRQLSSYGVPIADADIPAFTAWVHDSKTACGNSQFFVIRNLTAKLTLNLRGPVDGSPIRVWNGDGTTSSFSLTTGTDTNVGKVYGSTATRGIVVFGSIKELRSADAAGQGSDWYANLSGIPLATYVSISGYNTVTGNLSSIPLATVVNISGSNTVTGNLSGIPLATVVNIHGSNTVTGNLSSIPLAAYVSIIGSNTVMYNTSSGGSFPSNMRLVTLRPVASVFTSAMTDALCIDLAGVVTWTNEKLIDLRGDCGAATAASSAARTTLAGKGVTVYVN